MSFAFLKEPLLGHRAWTVSRWVLPLLERPAQELADLGVMGLGLAGEAAEVADVIEQWGQSGACPRDALIKELGDAFFYWSRLSEKLGAALPGEFGTPALMRFGQAPLLEALAFVRDCGLVSECVKKYLRDGTLNREKLDKSLATAYQSWHILCAAAGLDAAAVVAANQDKVEGRVQRGTQRGSGDTR